MSEHPSGYSEGYEAGRAEAQAHADKLAEALEPLDWDLSDGDWNGPLEVSVQLEDIERARAALREHKERRNG